MQTADGPSRGTRRVPSQPIAVAFGSQPVCHPGPGHVGYPPLPSACVERTSDQTRRTRTTLLRCSSSSSSSYAATPQRSIFGRRTEKPRLWLGLTKDSDPAAAPTRPLLDKGPRLSLAWCRECYTHRMNLLAATRPKPEHHLASPFSPQWVGSPALRTSYPTGIPKPFLSSLHTHTCASLLASLLHRVGPWAKPHPPPLPPYTPSPSPLVTQHSAGRPSKTARWRDSRLNGLWHPLPSNPLSRRGVERTTDLSPPSLSPHHQVIAPCSCPLLSPTPTHSLHRQSNDRVGPSQRVL